MRPHPTDSPRATGSLPLPSAPTFHGHLHDLRARCAALGLTLSSGADRHLTAIAQQLKGGPSFGLTAWVLLGKERASPARLLQRGAAWVAATVVNPVGHTLLERIRSHQTRRLP